MSSRLLVALKVTGPSALKVVGILVSLKAMVARNVNSHCCQDFGRSGSYSQLGMSTSTVDRILVALKSYLVK